MIITIDVVSIDEKLKEIESTGGKVVLQKQNLGNFEFYARFSDTESNVIGLWQDVKK